MDALDPGGRRSDLFDGADPADPLFSTEDAARLAGVSYRQIDLWAREGIIRPAVPARGSGTRRRYTGQQVGVVAVLGAVQRVARLMKRAGTLAAFLEGWPIDEWAGTLLVDEQGCAWRGMVDGEEPLVAVAVNLSAVRARLALQGVVWA